MKKVAEIRSKTAVHFILCVFDSYAVWFACEWFGIFFVDCCWVMITIRLVSGLGGRSKVFTAWDC